jgi:hypothetical protein
VLKILHITASYKPAFIYGGPIYSVAVLCEALSEKKEQRNRRSRKSEDVYKVESAKVETRK